MMYVSAGAQQLSQGAREGDRMCISLFSYGSIGIVLWGAQGHASRALDSASLSIAG